MPSISPIFTRKLWSELFNIPVFWMKAISSQKSGIQVKKIRYGVHPRQYFLYCLPEQGQHLKEKAILYIHGGGWRFGKPEHFLNHARLLASWGYPAILPSHRRVPFSAYPQMKEDLHLLLQKLAFISAQEGLPTQFIAGGMSSGGNLAAHIAFGEVSIPPPLNLAGTFLLGAPLNLSAMPPTLLLRSFAGARHSDTFRRANPYQHLSDAHSIPTLVVQGNRDGLVPGKAISTFAERLKSNNRAATQYLLLPRASHLDIASWVYQDNETRQALIQWFESLERQ
jgi:acetyl esterase/lipase